MTKPNWTPIKIRLGEITTWQANPRMSTKAQAQRIIESEKKFNQVVPFILSLNGTLLDGHQRLAAWLTVYGADHVMDAIRCDRELTEAEHKELVITLHSGATGQWDWQVLSGWSAPDLKGWGFDGDLLKQWNNDASNLKELIKSEEPSADAEPEVDRAGELQVKWGTATGQLWTLGEHRLLIGDCTISDNVQRLTDGAKCGACVTDSPYGINREGIENDDPEGLRALFDGCLAVMPIENGVIINFQSPRLFPVWLDAVRAAGQRFERALWMHKINDVTNAWRKWMMNGEIIIISSFGKPEWGNPSPPVQDCYTVTHDTEVKIAHTSVKPLSVFQDVIEHTAGDVYEPFAGSGTAIVACHNLGRRCFAMEISEKYAAVAIQRWVDLSGINAIVE